jgi:predicted metal-dependent hydrolase
MMRQTLAVDDLDFALHFSEQRKTMEIVIDREGELVLKAPKGTAPELLEEFVREKLLWVQTKLAHKRALQHERGRREFVNGEGFMYLGRSYRLLLVEEQDCPLKLTGGRFRLLKSELPRAQKHFTDWYNACATAWLGNNETSGSPREGPARAGASAMTQTRATIGSK